MNECVRIGMIIPSGGPEADYYAFEQVADAGVKLYFTISRIGGAHGNDHDLDALRETGQLAWITEAAQRLRGFDLDAITWACTSGSFMSGSAFAARQAEAIGQAVEAPATSTSLSFVDAMRGLGLHKASVLATYPEPTARAFCSFLGEAGLSVDALTCLDIPTGWDVPALPTETIVEKAVEAFSPGSDTLLIPDTAMPSLHFIETLEDRLNVPVLTANAVTLWGALELTGRGPSVSGYGTLLGQAI
ncbi:maleate cis-trans isomerase [Nitratireductor sp. CAU 1489]|uniref:Maleate cis-trans isomerase n=1 Tax=Nitratireductor arenosus TaxID=2682096 RepID=A0A844QDZ4_9HYPH|nr:maleate cis-trans isomerase [Nitratireductor arenosus]MVA96250.1 maleate cis-trans isomerase [Nitratireductor arenosus]